MAIFTVDELVKAAEQLPENDLEILTVQLLSLKARHNALDLSEDEAGLLKKINCGLSSDFQKRYQELIVGRQAETLTESEHAELLELTTLAEQHQAERLKYLGDLAHLREISLTELLDQLDIQPTYL